ncbi:MAG: hypothetical protein ACLRT4_10595 [Thomasclavelia sp.]
MVDSNYRDCGIARTMMEIIKKYAKTIFILR